MKKNIDNPIQNRLHIKQFLAFIRKEFYHVFRDSKTLVLLFGMPIAQILLFGFALTNEIKNTKIMVCDYANDATSFAITEQLSAGNRFEVLKSTHTNSDIEKEFKRGEIKLAIIFPANLRNDLLHLNTAQVQIIADASDPNTATTLTNYASNIIQNYQQSLNPTTTLPYRIKTEVRMIYNPELKGVTNFVPGVMALILFLICVLMTSVSIVREKEMGTMEVLLVSPFNPLLVVISKAVPYFVLSLINLTVILILSITLMDMPMHGSYILLYVESSLLILAALALGLLISNSTDSQQTAMLIALMAMLMPTMILTGFMFPLENMPIPLQVVANIIPSKWYYIIVKSIMIKGLGITAIWKETLILAGMTIVLLSISIRRFKIRL